ncbi:hypothetical protein [Bacillus sp. P14.5]|uniref:hypothetical protein n=1 Tax=Bacillus sp. P14.5 TaxID=1983400 RepID=UPI0013B051DA|nr:hypothetical protein [Bacillus sp. P14.5]
MTAWYIFITLLVAGAIVEITGIRFIKNDRSKSKFSILVWSSIMLIFLMLWVAGY